MSQKPLQPIFPHPISLFDPVHKTDPANVVQDWNVLGQFIMANFTFANSNATAMGAFGDGVRDDTATLQAILSANGVLFLTPGKNYLIKSPLVLTGNPSGNGGLNGIFGNGAIISSSVATPLLSFSNLENFILKDVYFSNSGVVGSTCVTLSNINGSVQNILNCFFAPTNIGIATSGGALGLTVTACSFFSSASVGVSIANQSGVTITGCVFASTSGTPITTSGTAVIEVRGCYGTGAQDRGPNNV